jgi:threonine/homoserine/homoserine lactone efflux protein
VSNLSGVKRLPGYCGTAPHAMAPLARTSVSSHILPTAATMVGACMTVLSIGRLSHAGKLGVVVDKMLAFDAVVFLVSAVLSFLAIRMVTRPERLETWAEELFLLGLSLSAIVAVVIAFAIDL